jgi:2-oxo-3-(phosphooxy)propyl 3-oxoalkanoate synthase
MENQTGWLVLYVRTPDAHPALRTAELADRGDLTEMLVPAAVIPGPRRSDMLAEPRSEKQPLTATVPREYVHRAAVAEVLLTDWQRQSDDTFTLRAQWPRIHPLFVPPPGSGYDPLIMAETIRQAGLLVAHAEFGVPLGHQFLMWELHFTAVPETLRVGTAPTELSLRVACQDIDRRGSSIAGMRYQVDLHQDGVRTGNGGARFTCTSPAVYRRLRGESTPPAFRAPTTVAAPPESVGRTGADDVLLTTDSGASGTSGPPDGGARRWMLRIDPTHPVYFDHPVDHAPGMLLLEAARQAAFAVHSPRPVTLLSTHASFLKYVELDRPCWIEAEPTGPDRHGERTVDISGHQDGQAVFAARLRVRSQ